eukprot:TRINITY_DN3650_c0_g1_i1.p1 TRINITY_DN3650_c0_g1~~TRINITY_DN3650_c0_g1_i1.p1  ORF type:complete len:193 (-),score=30.02 TRINITY_DN3650_c0_g1_i1:238-816(-)
MFQAYNNTEMPKKIRGIFWMAGNTFPENMCNFEAAHWDPVNRTAKLVWGTPLSWSYNSDRDGIVEYSLVQLSWKIHASLMQMEWNEDYMDAKLLLMCYGHVVGTWGIKQMDDVGNEWLRYGLTKLGHKEIPEYTVYKVIDADGIAVDESCAGRLIYSSKNRECFQTTVMAWPLFVSASGPLPQPCRKASPSM